MVRNFDRTLKKHTIEKWLFSFLSKYKITSLLSYFMYFLLLIVKVVITREGRKDNIMTPANTPLSFQSCWHCTPCFEMGFQRKLFHRSRHTQWICMFWKDNMFMPVSGLVCVGVCVRLKPLLFNYNFKSFLGQSRFSLSRK